MEEHAVRSKAAALEGRCLDQDLFWHELLSVKCVCVRARTYVYMYVSLLDFLYNGILTRIMLFMVKNIDNRFTWHTYDSLIYDA